MASANASSAGRSPPRRAEAARRRAFDAAPYLAQVESRVRRHTRYPEMAVQLGLEGTVRVRVTVNPDGSLAGAPRVDESSGHDLLDEEALRIVARAAPFPAIAGRRSAVRIYVPVRFHLDD
ncbi:MAG: energy transducer TonB [Polyangiales bacterium]